MEPIEYLRIFRRRWGIVALAGMLAAAAVWLTTPPTAEIQPRTTYRATHTLYRDPVGPQQHTISLETMALLATVGEIPRRVAEEIAPNTEPAVLAAEVEVAADSRLGTLTVASTHTNGERAARIANAFAEETLRFFDEREQSRALNRINRLTAQADDQEDRIRELDAELADLTTVTDDGQVRDLSVDAALVRAERDAAIRQYGTAVEQLGQLRNLQAEGSDLVTLESAVPVPQVETGFQAPQNRSARALLALLLGLGLGMVLAIASDRLDTRVRSRRGAEAAFGLPVVAEIPRVRGVRARHVILTADRPASFAAEAYRILRLTVQLQKRGHAGAEGRPPTQRWWAQTATRPSTNGHAQVILVTSPGPSEGKTTTVANLAVAFAELGKRVLVVDADFRHAEQHRYFGVDRAHGLAEYLEKGQARPLATFASASRLPNIAVVPNGTFNENPGELLAPDHNMLEEARGLADVVILDAGPILAVNDPQALIPQVDALVVVARSGRTTAEAARRTTELLARLDAPTVGVTLVGVPRSASGQPYYAQVRSIPHDAGRLRGLRRPRPVASGNGHQPEAARDEAEAEAARDEAEAEAGRRDAGGGRRR